jgi:hypothetical protein
MSEPRTETGVGGCPPLMVCTDRPELCPPACRPVIRNAGANSVIPPTNRCGWDLCGDPNHRLTAFGGPAEECLDCGEVVTTPTAKGDL